MNTTRHEYQIEMEVTHHAPGGDNAHIAIFDVQFTYTPNDDRLNPECRGEYEIAIEAITVSSVNGIEVRTLYREAADTLSGTMIRQALDTDHHQGAMLDIARGS